ncbi:MAG: hypothetical protein KDA80_10070, partial [Planctomycetaceae bacterium]|nr:hypothetical protein [Planctomycetaceae bacterium]
MNVEVGTWNYANLRFEYEILPANLAMPCRYPRESRDRGGYGICSKNLSREFKKMSERLANLAVLEFENDHTTIRKSLTVKRLQAGRPGRVMANACLRLDAEFEQMAKRLVKPRQFSQYALNPRPP